MTGLVETVKAFAALEDRLPSDDEAAQRVVLAALDELCLAVDAASRAGMSDDAILTAVQPARAVHARSPFWQRVYSWPQDVVGDYLTIEWLCQGTLHAPTGSVAACLERRLLSFPASQQHRNKIQWQADQVAGAVSAGARKILSVACGGCLDLRARREQLIGQTRFYLNDIDEEAIRFGVSHLIGLEKQVQVLPGNLLRSLKLFHDAGPFDLIIAGGIFDYLEDGLFRRAVGRLAECLAPGGRLCLTNYASPNPYRTWMKYFGDWVLIERTEDQISSLVSAAIGEGGELHLSRDATGLAILAEIRTQREGRVVHTAMNGTV
ncbi:MAG: class I SAM-dependent methyltransferase [Blastocatellia bacterium]|nr:class I SAM-dependent methyltransferase [Blastocatellia bacterium]